MNRILIIILLINFFGSVSINAQELHYTFTNLNEKNGLRNNIIFSMLKDSHGILWVGTQNGLNRFDGSHFYTFKKTNDANSLPNNSIESLCEDKKGNIWGGTDNGIFCFTPSQNKFTIYNAPSDCYDNIISNIGCDKAGNIFAATSLALLKFNKASNRFERIIRLTNNKDSLGYYTLIKNSVLFDDANNGFWLTTRSGLLFYDNKQQKLFGSFNNSNNPLFEKRMTSAISKSPNGNYWFFDNQAKEAIAFNPTTKKIVKKINVKKELPKIWASTILDDGHNRLWISSWSYDMFTIDLTNEKIGILKSNEGVANSVAADFFWAARVDENGSVWLGTTNGISICSPNQTVYKSCDLHNKIPILKSTVVFIIEEAPIDRTWWIVTANLQVIQYNPYTEKYVVYHLKDALPDKNGLRPQRINRLLFVNNQVVLTSSMGAWKLESGKNQFSPYRLLPKQYDDLVIRNMIVTDSIFYLTDGMRMLAWNHKNKTGNWITNKTPLQNTEITFGFVELLWKPNHDLYWTMASDYIGNIGNNYEANKIKLNKNDSTEAGGYFHAADMDNEGNVWVINKGVGLYCYNTTTKKIKYWTELDGLMDNHLHGIKADDNGNIWTSYFNKVSVFNPSKNSFINFAIPYSENNLNYFNWLTKRTDGVVMGSIANEVFEFYGNSLNLVPINKTPEFCYINISGENYFITTENKLVLNPYQNSIRFNFGLLADAALYPFEFEYQLEGFDKNWQHATLTNEAVYNNLEPGTYTFRLVAKGRNNAWQSAEKVLIIVIKTPFYKTYWFKALLFIFIMGALYLFYRYRLRQKEKLLKLESKTQLLEKEKTVVMYESLKQQLNPHFLFNSLTSLSGLIETNQQLAGSFLEQMSGIYRYILKNGDHETVTIKDEITFVRLYINLQQTRFKKGLQVNINIPDEFFHYKIAPVTLQNLIENAIKHNIIDVDTPLVIDIYIENEYIVVQNNLHKKNIVETSNKKGLIQFETLYKYLSEKPILIEENTETFTIKIPLI